MSVYEVHLGSWRKPYGGTLNYGQLADELTGYVKDLGFTHVELMPVMQHPFGGSWGYHVTSYFAPDSRFGDPDGFRYLVDRLHQAGIGVILDWVPGHFATDEWALARFDGTPLYEDPNPQRGWHKGWGSHIFNFGRHEVRNYLYANALYWLEEFHADGLRVDAVASMLYLDYDREDGEWTPNKLGGNENLEAVQFLQEMNATVYKRVPGAVTIAEESTSWPGVTRATSADGLGFGLKWNMGWMNDSLRYMAKDPIYRAHHHGEMTFSLVYAFSENYVLPISHDEVVHGKGSLLRKMPGDRWQQLANLRAFLAYMWAHPGKQLLFMGAEFGQESEWAEARELDWWLMEHSEHRGVHQLVKDLNRVYVDSPALWAADAQPDGFQWIDADDAGRNTFSFIRRGPSTARGRLVVVCVANFSAMPHPDYRLGLPSAGTWEEVVNTDAQLYTGSGVGNLGTVEAVVRGPPRAARQRDHRRPTAGDHLPAEGLTSWRSGSPRSVHHGLWADTPEPMRSSIGTAACRHHTMVNRRRGEVGPECVHKRRHRAVMSTAGHIRSYCAPARARPAHGPLASPVRYPQFFSRGMARAHGVDDKPVTRLVRSGAWRRFRRGYYCFSDLWDGYDQLQRHRARSRSILHSLGAMSPQPRVRACRPRCQLWGFRLTASV